MCRLHKKALHGGETVEIGVILLLILAAALHATWNFLSKRSIDKQAFLWLTLVAALAIYALPTLLFYTPIPPEGWAFILLSGLSESLYFILLAASYRQGDLSLVYPLARGSAPLFVTLFAAIFLGERVTLGGLAGIALIVIGIYILHLKSLNRTGLLAPFLSWRERATQLALLVGVMIGVNTVLDKAGVGYVHPLPYLYLLFVVTTLTLAPYMLLARRDAIRTEWRLNKASILAVAVMNVAAFLLVLIALTISKASYVSPVREVSVVFGALLGTLLLREPFAAAKVAGSALIFVGIFCIALSN